MFSSSWGGRHAQAGHVGQITARRCVCSSVVRASLCRFHAVPGSGSIGRSVEQQGMLADRWYPMHPMHQLVAPWARVERWNGWYAARMKGRVA